MSLGDGKREEEAEVDVYYKTSQSLYIFKKKEVRIFIVMYF